MTINRIFAATLVAFAGIWIYAFVEELVQDSNDRAFHAEHVVPYLNAQARKSAALRQALEERKKGVRTPLPHFDNPGTKPLDEWVHRMQRRADGGRLRFYSGILFIVSLFGWSIALLLQRELVERRRQPPDRPADPNAGARIADLNRAGGIFVAKSSGNGRLQSTSKSEVHIDTRKGTVVFHGFTFITSFVGNRRTERTEVPLSDILGARVYFNRGRSSLRLRTTSGWVGISDRTQPFQPLAEILFDAAELNRKSPEKYRAALDREPVAHTPWYGWVIIAIAFGAVAGTFGWVMHD